MSRSRFAATGLTCVAAHPVIGENTRSRAVPKVISEAIQSCSFHPDDRSKKRFRGKSDRIDRHAHRRFERRDARAVDQGDVFIGRRIRFAARIGKGVSRRLEDAQRPVHGGPKNSATSLHPSFSVIRSRNSTRPFSAIVKTPLSASKRSATARVSRRASA
jgi:hypothetical protein